MTRQIPNDGGGIEHIETLPDTCPHCHRSIFPVPMYGHKVGRNLEVFFHCPNPSCNQSFIGFYGCGVNNGISPYLNRTAAGSLKERDFSKNINDLSPMFGVIYNQANSAEQYNLVEICGVGYRKALEFLIKDYAVKNNPEKKEVIIKQTLAQTISEFIADINIKSVAQRAVWLGNDETHYTRKWEGRDLQDLKKLIDLTLHWVEMEALTKSFNEEMPG
jgi:hypothetical protein